MTTKTLAERLRLRAAAPGVGVKQSRDMQEAADALDAKDAEIARLREALEAAVQYMELKVTEYTEPYPFQRCRAALRK